MCASLGEGLICVENNGVKSDENGPCEAFDGCKKGLACAEAGSSAECDADTIGCCQPFCDTSIDACDGLGQECIPLFAEGAQPPGLELVGVCSLP